MNISCEIIKDILPLYAENMISNDTRDMVEGHLAECAACAAVLEELCRDTKISVDTGAENLKKVRTGIHKRRFKAVLLGVLATFTVMLCVIGYLTGPEYLTAEEAVLGVSEEDGRISVEFNGSLVDYFVVHEWAMDGEDKNTVKVSCAANRWETHLGLDNDRRAVPLAVSAEDERLIYGREETLLWGSRPQGVTQYPKPILSICFFTALVLGGVLLLCGILCWKKKIGKAAAAVSGLLLGFVLSNLVVCGMDLRTYEVLTDNDIWMFLAITVVLALAMFATYLAARSKWKQDHA